MFRRVFIANRGEIALRVARTARRLGIEAAGAFSTVDGGLPHLRLCQAAVELDGEPARVYLEINKVVDAAKKLKADAVHPGYGFLAENEAFAEAVEAAGMKFIGPTPEQIVALGDKVQARIAAEKAGVPTVPGKSEAIADPAAAAAIATKLGFPVLIKAAGGGGGRGMRIVEQPSQLAEAIARAQSEAKAAFDDPRVFVEKFLPRARHVEIQIVGDGKGSAVWLGERECSVQRRHQKLIEESPTTALPPDVVAKMGALAARLAASVNYRGAGTMEFLVPAGTQEFYFIEMNTRLQVEHPVTELCTGLDLVEEQFHIAARGSFSPRLLASLDPATPGRDANSVSERGVVRRGHAIEARVIAEDPETDFRPSAGPVELALLPSGPGIRTDAWIEPGLAVSPYYDSLLAKVLAWGNDRNEAIQRLVLALHETRIAPLKTTAGFLSHLIQEQPFVSGDYDTGWLARRKAERAAAGKIIPQEAMALAATERLRRASLTLPSARYEGRRLSGWQRRDEG
ncbi:MAG TPA: biotin carboxylase N-terminal domain-containing protein [Planctomycetota bacterium]|nr:biotin carboxylase N-terminal domain-containing protein [Planctomycetota bacterium]